MGGWGGNTHDLAFTYEGFTKQVRLDLTERESYLKPKLTLATSAI